MADVMNNSTNGREEMLMFFLEELTINPFIIEEMFMLFLRICLKLVAQVCMDFYMFLVVCSMES